MVNAPGAVIADHQRGAERKRRRRRPGAGHGERADTRAIVADGHLPRRDLAAVLHLHNTAGALTDVERERDLPARAGVHSRTVLYQAADLARQHGIAGNAQQRVVW